MASEANRLALVQIHNHVSIKQASNSFSASSFGVKWFFVTLQPFALLFVGKGGSFPERT